MDKFDKNWDRIEKELLAKQTKAITQAISKVYNSTIDRTPVGRPELWKSKPSKNYKPGDLRKAWEINWGTGFINSVSSYSGKLSAVSGSLHYKLGNDVYIRNRTEYAYTVEYGWSRKQAPYGMMRISVKQFDQFLKESVESNKI